jgi:hypothetical protein
MIGGIRSSVKVPRPNRAGDRRRGWVTPPKLGGGAITAAIALAAPAAAQAYETPTPTAQATAAHAAFLASMPASMPASRPVVCVVDSGIDANDDTTPQLVGAASVYGGTTADVDPDTHGTEMAMAAVAPLNGWGMVGAFAGAGVYSVRAMQAGETGYATSAVYQAINKCRQAKIVEGVNIKVISLSLGSSSSPPTNSIDYQQAAVAVDQARSAGIDVVAAAGNRSMAIVDFPANLSGVLTIAASDSAGGRCSIASYGPEVDLWTLGCGVDTFYFPTQGQGIGTGSSWSTAYTAGVLAAIRDRMPALSVDQAEQLLTSTAAGGSAGPLLDATAAFRTGGQGALVDQYTPAAPSGGASGGGGGGGGDSGAAKTVDPAPAAPAPAPVSVPAAPVAAADPPVKLSPAELEEAACEQRKGWCVRPDFASVQRVRGGKLQLQLVRVPSKATVVIRVDGKTLLRSKPQRKHARWVKRSNFSVRASSSYREVTITYVQAGRGKSLPLRLTPEDLDE